ADRRAYSTAMIPNASLGGCRSNHAGSGEPSGPCERAARSSLLRRATRHASSVVAALPALAPRLVRLARHDYSDRLLGAERREVDAVELGDVLAEDRAPLLRGERAGVLGQHVRVRRLGHVRVGRDDRVAHDARPRRSTRPGSGPAGATASRPSSRITTPFTTTARMPCASETSRSAPAGAAGPTRSG